MRIHASLSLALLAICLTPKTIGRMIDVPAAKVINAAQERILSNVVVTHHYPKRMRASFRVMNSGRIDDVKLSFINKDPESALSLLEAIHGSSPLPPFTDTNGDLLRSIEVFLDLDKLQKNSRNGMTEGQRNSAEKLKVHLIPIDVVNRYPALFSRSELTGATNLAELPSNALIVDQDNVHPGPSKKLMDFFRAWERFFSDHPKGATRTEVLEFKERVKTALMSSNTQLNKTLR